MVGMGNGMSGCHQFLVESPRCRRARARLHRAAEAHDVETMIRRGGKGFCFFFGDKPSTRIFFQCSTLLLNDMFEIYRWFVENIEDWVCWRMLSDITIWGKCHRLFVKKRPRLLFFGGNDQPQECFEVGGSWLESWLHVTRSLDQLCVFFGIWEPCHPQWLNNACWNPRLEAPYWPMLLWEMDLRHILILLLGLLGEESREDPNF